MEKFSVTNLAKKIPTEAAAYKYLEGVRWNGRPVCPHCGVIDGHYFLIPKNGTSRETSRGRMSERRTWKCHDCRKQFSVTTGTVMHGSHVALRVWLFIFFEMAGNKNGIAAREIARKYGVNPRTAWHITQRIREAMANGSPVAQMVGTIIADETYFGGDPMKKHASKRAADSKQGKTDKQPIFTIMNKETGVVSSHVVPDAKSKTLDAVLAQVVDRTKSELHTDGFKAYIMIGRTFAKHEVVDHKAGEYVRGNVSTNAVEGYFSQFKRSVNGTHHSITVDHLRSYLGEFDLRYSTRDITDQERMGLMIQRTAGRSLSYDELRGRRRLSA